MKEPIAAVFLVLVTVCPFLVAMPQSSARIQGQVVDASTGNPIPGVQIKISALSALSDADGKFAVSNIPAGRQSLITSKDGYLTAHCQKCDIRYVRWWLARVLKDDPIEAIVSDQDGTFELTVPRPGDYRPLAWNLVLPCAPLNRDFLKKFEGFAEPVKVEGSGSRIESIVVHVAEPAGIDSPPR